jgi:uncharacterized protein
VASRRQILDLAQRIAQLCHPRKIILFGSHAHGKATRASDVDLLVVMPYRGRALDVAVELLHRANPRFAVDLIVQRPEEIIRRYREFDPLARDAIDRGRVLYDRDGQPSPALSRPSRAHLRFSW